MNGLWLEGSRNEGTEWEIAKEEVRYTIRKMKSRKTTGVNGIAVGFLMAEGRPSWSS